MKRTRAADAYVAAKRRESNDAATWFDVAEAYDKGLYHGVEARESAKKAIAELDTFETGAEHGK